MIKYSITLHCKANRWSWNVATDTWAYVGTGTTETPFMALHEAKDWITQNIIRFKKP